MKATVRMTIVSELTVANEDREEFLKQLSQMQAVALPASGKSSEPATGNLTLTINGFEWKDAKAVVQTVSTEIGK